MNGPVIIVAAPVNVPLCPEDVISQALSVIRGQMFGRRSTEVTLLIEALRANGFEIVRSPPPSMAVKT